MKLLTGRRFRGACSPPSNSILIIEAEISSETSVLFHQIAKYHIPDDSKKKYKNRRMIYSRRLEI
jgi:hypothetical protein